MPFPVDTSCIWPELRPLSSFVSYSFLVGIRISGFAQIINSPTCNNGHILDILCIREYFCPGTLATS